jgi:hypothetical protein
VYDLFHRQWFFFFFLNLLIAREGGAAKALVFEFASLSLSK